MFAIEHALPLQLFCVEPLLQDNRTKGYLPAECLCQLHVRHWVCFVTHSQSVLARPGGLSPALVFAAPSGALPRLVSLRDWFRQQSSYLFFQVGYDFTHDV